MRTATEEKLLVEIERLIEAGVLIQFENGSNLGKQGFAKIDDRLASGVLVYIADSDTPEMIADYLVEAGTLLDKLAETRAYERNHPDFRMAIKHRVWQGKRGL